MKKDMEQTLKLALDGITSGVVIASGKSTDGYNYVLLKHISGKVIFVRDESGAVSFDISANLGDKMALKIRSNDVAEWVLCERGGSDE